MSAYPLRIRTRGRQRPCKVARKSQNRSRSATAQFAVTTLLLVKMEGPVPLVVETVPRAGVRVPLMVGRVPLVAVAVLSVSEAVGAVPVAEEDAAID